MIRSVPENPACAVDAKTSEGEDREHGQRRGALQDQGDRDAAFPCTPALQNSKGPGTGGRGRYVANRFNSAPR